MSNEKVVSLAPTREAALHAFKKVPKAKRFSVRPHVKTALAAILADEEKYDIMLQYFNGGAFGGVTYDAKRFSEMMMYWEQEAGRTALLDAYTNGATTLPKVKNALVDILKKEVGMLIKRGEILGLEHDGDEEE